MRKPRPREAVAAETLGTRRRNFDPGRAATTRLDSVLSRRGRDLIQNEVPEKTLLSGPPPLQPRGLMFPFPEVRKKEKVSLDLGRQSRGLALLPLCPGRPGEGVVSPVGPERLRSPPRSEAWGLVPPGQRLGGFCTGTGSVFPGRTAGSASSSPTSGGPRVPTGPTAQAARRP